MERPTHLTAALVMERIPKFNPTIAGGIATEHFKEIPEYIHSILVESSNYLGEGLTYLGYRRALPEEEANFIIKHKAAMKKSHWTVELADSTVYLMHYDFDYNGSKITHSIYLPYLHKGAQMWIRGTPNAILPVLTAPVFSVETMRQQVFIKLLMGKLTFLRLNHSVVMDDVDTILSVVYAPIHRHNPKNSAHYDSRKDESVKMYPASTIYLFCEYGVTKSFQRYCGFTPIISCGAHEFNSEEERQKYVVFRSRQRKPITVKARHYSPHDIQIAIPKEKAEDIMTLGMVAGFFYIADSYSQFMISLEELEETDFWKIILGKSTFRTKDAIADLLEQTEKHMSNVRRMLDSQMKSDLVRSDIQVDDMIDLLAYAIGHFPMMLRDAASGSLYGKRLLVLRNVLEDIIIGINTLTFKTSKHGRIPTEKNIRQNISLSMISDKILALQNTPYRETASGPSDNMMFRNTCKFLLQNNISKKTKGGVETNIHNPDNHLHSSVMEVGTYQGIKDSEVTGRAILNPYQITSKSGITKMNPELKDKIDYIQYYLNND